jgi:hypothetical protein
MQWGWGVAVIVLFSRRPHVLYHGRQTHVWYCKPGQKPVTGKVIGPSWEVTAIFMLNEILSCNLGSC